MMDDNELDLEYLYTHLAKRGRKPSEAEEEAFIEEVDALASPCLTRAGARRQVLERLYSGKA